MQKSSAMELREDESFRASNELRQLTMRFESIPRFDSLQRV